MNQARRTRLVTLLALIAAAVHAVPPVVAGGSTVSIGGDPAGGWRLMRDGRDYRIRGAGGEASLEMLAACGGNTIRTWGVEAVEKPIDGERMIDRAHRLGIAVTIGLWLGHERHGFDWSDEEALSRQRRMVEDAVFAYREHPAVLCWGLGNEMESPPGRGDKPEIWREVNALARRIKELDPRHPVMTVVANFSPEKLAAITAHAPDIDILGVNAYAGAERIGERLQDAGWPKPYCITEFGLRGAWEAEQTPWNAPVEPTSRDKAESTAAVQAAVAADPRCLGSYAFLWGQKQEATSSWFGMFLPSGEKTARVDAMALAWSGQWPANRAPVLDEAEVPFREAEVTAGEIRPVWVRYTDPDDDLLTYAWEVREESGDRRMGGDAERPPPSVPGAVSNTDGRGAADIRMPSRPGAYRLFVTVTDGHGSGAVDNWPFFVRP